MLPGKRQYNWRLVQAIVVRETSEQLSYMLRHPDEFARIPSGPIGRVFFSREFSERFWKQALGI